MLNFKKKRMRKIQIIFIVTLIISLSFTACDKEFLETAPTDQVAATVVTETTGNALAALNGIHRALYVRYGSQGRGGAGHFNMAMSEMGEDHVFNANNYTTQLRWLLTDSPSDAFNTAHWGMFYEWIANCPARCEAFFCPQLLKAIKINLSERKFSH